MPLVLDSEVAGNLAVAALAGLAVGIEREWSGHASGPAARFAGARTFLLLGLVGGLAGWFTSGGLVVLGGVLLAGAAALVVSAYVMAARRGPEDVEGTTEVAAIAVLAMGATAGFGFPLLTSGAASLMVLALVEKTRIQELISRIGKREMAATLQFAVLALVILPMLPKGPYGPYDSIRPQALWIVVLFFSGLSFLGYLARRAVGQSRGYAVAGMLGGLVSSTAVALAFARQSREEAKLAPALALGAVGASTVVLPRVLLIATVLNPGVAWAALRYLLPPLVIGLGFLAIVLVRQRAPMGDHAQDMQSPLRLWLAIKMAIGFQAVLLLIPLVQQLWGTPGVLTSAAIIGLTDMDALTLSMARLGASPEAVPIAAKSIAIGMLANTFVKLAVILVFGSAAFRRRAGLGLAALAGGSILGLWLIG